MKNLINTFVLNFIIVFSVQAANWPEMSIYNLQSKWKTNSGEEIVLDHFAGHPVVIAMVYTSCKHTCPLVTAKMRIIEKELSSELKSNTNFVMISFDPDRDTPKVLNKYAQKMKLGGKWTLLTGKDSIVRELAAILGVNYKRDSEGEFSHSNIISLLDAKGEIVTQLKSLSEDEKPLIDKIKTLK